MTSCRRHHWLDRSETLREAFAVDSERSTHSFFVCQHCARILEVCSADAVVFRPLRFAHAA